MSSAARGNSRDKRISTSPPIGPSNVESQSLNPPPPNSGGGLRWVFLGADGLRAGWRFVLYLLIAALVEIVLATVTHFAGHRYLKGAPRIWFLIGESELLVAAVAAALVMSLIEKRPLGAYGLPRCGAFGKLFWLGALWGIPAITLLLVVIRAVGDFYFGAIVLHGAHIAKFALFWGLFFLVVGFFEEFLMRGYTLFTLTKGIGFWPAGCCSRQSLAASTSAIREKPGLARFCGLDWTFFLPHLAAYRNALVCGGHARRVGLGGELPVLGSGQRHFCARAPDEILLSGLALADRRNRGAGGQRAGIRRDCRPLGFV